MVLLEPAVLSEYLMDEFQEQKKAMKKIMEAAKGGSRWLWLRRDASHCALPGHTVGPDHSRLGHPGESV